MGVSDEPSSPGEAAGSEALDLFAERIEALGGEVKQAMLYAWVEPMRPNGVSVGLGFDDPEELFDFLLAQAKGVGAQLGFTLELVPVENWGAQG